MTNDALHALIAENFIFTYFTNLNNIPKKVNEIK